MYNSTFFTIIVTVKNPIYVDLFTTLNSILSQKYLNCQIIIKDSSTNEHVRQWVKEFESISYHIQPDEGVYDGMNQALIISKGEFICFLNSGDFFYDSDVLTKMNLAISNNPNKVFYFGGVRKLKSKLGYEFYPERLTRFFGFSGMVCHQCWFVCKDYYFVRNYDVKYRVDADYHFFLRMIFFDNVPYLNTKNIIATYQGGGISATDKSELRKELRKEIIMTVYSKYEILLFDLWKGIKRFSRTRLNNRFVRYIYLKVKLGM
jgi:glycosyltransferase involved in cell wall biosynthesis